MVDNRYLMIRRWKASGTPDRIRMLESGDSVRLSTGGTFRVERVGIDKVLLDGPGWVDWREIRLDG